MGLPELIIAVLGALGTGGLAKVIFDGVQATRAGSNAKAKSALDVSTEQRDTAIREAADEESRRKLAESLSDALRASIYAHRSFCMKEHGTDWDRFPSIPRK